MSTSPRSSLSSFRDHIRHTSEYDSEYSQVDIIHLKIGLGNFKFIQVFKRCGWRLKEAIFWDMFDSFQKIKNFNSSQSKRDAARSALGRVLDKINNKESKVSVKRKALHSMLEGA